MLVEPTRQGLNPLEIGSLCNLIKLLLSDAKDMGLNPLEIGSLCNLWFLNHNYHQKYGLNPLEIGSLCNKKSFKENAQFHKSQSP